jgi:hypothetical protein
MAHNTARIGRRRRVLNEEALAASALGIAARSREDSTRMPGDTPRYGAGANIENHPQVTDFVPRRYRVIALVMMAGVALGVCGELIARHAATLSELIGNVSPGEITTTLAGGLVAWTSAAALLLAACYARLIHSLRRHRVDDSRGRYRVWRLAAWVAVLLSLNAVVDAHTIIARGLGHFTGWSVLSGNAGWWLAPAALLGGWLLVKLIREASECRTALASYLLAMVCFVTAGVACCWSPAWASQWHDTLCRLLPLGGDILLTTGTLLFARYVVLDVQGLIEHSPTAETSSSSVSAAAEPAESSASDRRPEKPKAAEAKPSEDAWVDGSEAEDLHEEESGGRRLNKAERKRLRKQKSRNRAA